MSKLSLIELERLNTWLPEIVAELQPGSPVKNQPDGSVRIGRKGSIKVGPEAGLWCDHGAGAGGRDALSLVKHLNPGDPGVWIQNFLSGHDGNGALDGASADEAVDALEASAAAVTYFLNQAVSVEGTQAELYLRSRGIEPPYQDNIQFVRDARLGEGALVAVVRSGDEPVAVQVTYLDATGKKSSVEPRRRTYRCRPDWSAVGCFSVTSKSAPERTIIVEGVEDALSLSKAGAARVVIASLGISNIGKHLPNSAGEVIVFRDGDEPGTRADHALQKGVDRLILAGASVRVTETPIGCDANDIYISDGAEALLRLIDGAPEAALSPEGVFDKCAVMSGLEYEQCRKKTANDLDIRLEFLDGEVESRRKYLQLEIEADDSAALNLAVIEPWPEQVDLASILDEIALALGQYVHLQSIWIYTCALWAALTHVPDRVHVLPRLAAQSPGPGCGKTVLMEAISILVPRPLTAASITAASVFRVIEALEPTLLIDEADQLFGRENADLVAIMNSGHRRSSAYVIRTVEVQSGQHEAVRFSTYAPMMTASIGELPPTLQDRSIVIRLQRALPGEVGKHLRDGYCPTLKDCARKLARWAQDVADLPYVSLPNELSNRLGDNWQPLFGIADLAGGEWPSHVMAAAKASLGAGDHGLIAMLLTDIREVFGERDRLSSLEIVDGLIAMEEAPYGEINRGRSITPHWLAKQLDGVIPDGSQTIRFGKKTAKGYYQKQFEEAWRRYSNAASIAVGPESSDVTSVTPSQLAETLPPSGAETVTPELSQRHKTNSSSQLLRCDDQGVTDKNCTEPIESATCDGVTGVTAESPPSTEASGTTEQEVW